MLPPDPGTKRQRDRDGPAGFEQGEASRFAEQERIDK
jgi:hypothetical protein